MTAPPEVVLHVACPECKRKALAIPTVPRESTPFYRAIVAEMRRQIRALGFAMWQCDDKAGLNDGHLSHLLHPDTPSGRMAQWKTLQWLLDALYPQGVRVTILPLPTAARIGDGLRTRSPDIARKMAALRVSKQTPERRRQLARRAIRARWRRHRQEPPR